MEAAILPLLSPREGSAQDREEAARFLVRGLASSYGMELVEGEDSPLFLLRASDGRLLVVDAQDPRFWLCHAPQGAEPGADAWAEGLLDGSPSLERAWLPSPLLERLARTGRWTGLTLSHGAAEGQSHPGRSGTISRLQLQVDGREVQSVLEGLRASGAFPHSLALTAVEVELPDREGGGLTRVGADHRGTLRGRGSYATHTDLARALAAEYRQLVELLEDEGTLGLVREGRLLRLAGWPVSITFSRRPASLQELAEYLWNGGEPFGLWGVPWALSPGLVRARLVDVRRGGRLSAELGEGFLRLYLPRGSRGSLVARLYTLLLCHYDSSARLAGRPGRALGGA